MVGLRTDVTQGLRRYAVVLAIVWTLCIVATLVVDIIAERHQTVEIARVEATLAWETDLVYRRWAARHGGVYVPATGETPPNPHLADVPERDITTETGRDLTLVNPAYMTRQVHEMAQRQFGNRGHITSLNPLRPENAADEWERGALQAFEGSETLVAELAEIDGRQYMRYMRPMLTEEACLKCHAGQGYAVGDIRGGISVSVPMEPLWATARESVAWMLGAHTLIWALGLAGLELGRRKFRNQMLKRAEVERELRESEAKYRSLLDNLPLRVCCKDTDSTYIAVNPAFARGLGLAPEDIVGKRDDDLFPADLARTIRRRDRDLIAGGVPEEFDEAFDDDGVKVAIHTIKVPTFDSVGRPTGLLDIFWDITDRKLIEDTLRYSLDLSQKAGELSESELTQSIVNEATHQTASTIGFFHLLDSERGIVRLKSWSSGTMHNCGVSEARMDYPISEAGIWVDCIARRRPTICNDCAAVPERGRLPEGHVPLKRFLAVPVIENDVVTAIIGVGNKTSDYEDADADRLAFLAGNAWGVLRRRQVEEENVEHARRLELLNEDLACQKDTAERATAAKSEFLASMSHELRSPLNTILILADLLGRKENGGLTAKDRRFAQTIEGAGRDLLELINDILDLSKVEAGRMPIEWEPVLVRDLARNVETMFEATAREKGLSFTVVVEANLPETMITDSRRVSQILKNLLSNAFKFTEEGAVTLRVGRSEESGGDAASIVFSVADTGIGISADQLAAVFDDYAQAEPGTNRRYGGTGLGLSLSRKFALALEGRLEVRSRTGEGSTFTLVLPEGPVDGLDAAPWAETGDDEPRKRDARGQEAVLTSAADEVRVDESLAGAKLLLIDGDMRAAFVFRSALERAGIEVFIAPTVDKGLELLRVTGDIDVVMVDLIPPVADGLDTLRVIRGCVGGSETPLIAITALAMEGDRRRCLEAGADDYLAKPVETCHLYERIAAWLGDRRGQTLS